jgi:hypothetical protein
MLLYGIVKKFTPHGCGKAVLLDFSKDSTVILSNGATIIVGKVHDLAGNSTEALATTSHARRSKRNRNSD